MMTSRPTARRSRSMRLLLTLALLLGALRDTSRADESEGWPRELDADGIEIVVYQPQLESFEGNLLRGRAAVSVRLPDAAGPAFGTVWMEARTDTDLDARLVTLRSLSVPRVRFAEATEDQQAALAAILEQHIPSWELEMSLDRILAGVEELDKRAREDDGFQDAPPAILFAQSPTVLVSLEGPPKFWPIDQTTLQSVVNSAFFIVQNRSGGPFYLYAGDDLWYSAVELQGKWTVAPRIPDEVRKQQPQEPAEPEGEEAAPEAEDAPPEDTTPPAILVVTEPSELIVMEGKPSYKPLGEGELLYVDNTDGDVLLELASQRHYVLIAGRWFSAASLDGPWKYTAADALPDSFAKIPEDSDMGHVLAWVAGTEMAEEVAADAYVPQTSAIRRDATIQVTYDGDPKFEPIEGTTLQHAVNTQSQVIRDDAGCYCADEGVWYVAAEPEGPWSVATEVPDEIQNIPASSPVYNTKYVYIFESTPEVVYVGYYPGYTHCYTYHGCLVYGTGWWYRPYWRAGYYYPHHSTWGFHARYNPWNGWSFGLSWSNGPFTFSIGRGGVHGWFGPAWRGAYRRGYAHGYNRGWQDGFRHGARAGYAAGQQAKTRNIYNQQANRARNAATARGTRPTTKDTRPTARGSRPTARGSRPATTPARGAETRQAIERTGPSSRVQLETSRERANNVYADREGNVHRRTSEGNWQSRQNGNWQAGDRSPTTRPSTGGTRTRPSSRPAPSARPSHQQSLDRSHQSRQRGTQRTQASHSRAGAARGGRRR